MVMGKPLMVVFLIDALGWKIAERFDFCRGLLDRKAPLGTVLGYSSAAIPSLLSGTKPSQHGAWAMWRLAKSGRSPFWYLRHVPKLPHPLEWRVRHLVWRFTDRRRVIEGYYDLYEIPLRLLAHFDVSQHSDPYQPGGLSQETIFDHWSTNGVPHRVWYYKTPEEDNMRQLLEAVPTRAEVLFLYTAELDALMHRVGIYGKEVEEKLRGYERFLESVLQWGDRVGRRTSVYVVSDHGMTDVRDTFDLWGELERKGFQNGRDYLGFYDSTMARFWGGERACTAAAEILSASGAGRMLSDEELESYGCLFDDREYGDTVFLANPGVMFVPSFMGRERLAAMHGYDPGDEFSIGCFATNDDTGKGPASILEVKSYLIGRLPRGDS
jgi:predicted AlkP superfamily pyrophosphatase or phosphodiesterase